MCGIMAWAGRSPKSFNQDKFNNLGIQNETRGTHSCGVSVDGEIYFGIDEKKRFRDFLAQGGYPMPKKIPIVIGHTRHATNGSHTAANAHPFGFGDAKGNKELFAFIGVHNGTIYNHEDLAKEFGVEPYETSVNEKNAEFTRNKIDSEILLEIIFTSGKFKVLSQYNGAAALVFYNVNEPDTIFAFHGASVKQVGGNDKSLYIERELWAWQEHKNSLYISSQDHGLITIGGTEETMTNLKTNVVYKIKNGNLATATLFPLSRNAQQHEKEWEYQKKDKNKGKGKAGVGPINKDNGYADYYQGFGGSSKAPAMNFHKNTFNSKATPISNIFNDNQYGPKTSKITVEKLRYNRNGHGINGVYVWVVGHGFHFAGFTLEAAEKSFKLLVNKKWHEGDFIFSEERLKDIPENEITVPFPENVHKKITDFSTYFHYFIDGMKIISHMDWKAALDLKKNGNGFSIQAISNITCHPVVDIDLNKDPENQGIFYKGVLATSAGFTPLGTPKIYEIDRGNCISIKMMETAAHRASFSNVQYMLEEFNKNEDANGPKVILLPSGKTPAKDEIDPVEEGILETLIDEIFCPIIDKAIESRERLNKYKDTELGRDALETIQELINNASKLVAEDITEEV